MTIKTVCSLSLKREEGFDSYTGYEVYPLASIFADSDDNALISYLLNMISTDIEIQECPIMEVTFECGETLRFYRAKEINTKLNRVGIKDYIVIDVPFIGC